MTGCCDVWSAVTRRRYSADELTAFSWGITSRSPVTLTQKRRIRLNTGSIAALHTIVNGLHSPLLYARRCFVHPFVVHYTSAR